MLIPVICPKCTTKEKMTPQWYQDSLRDVADNGYYKTKCTCGFEFLTIIQQQKFELLFQIGAYALKSGDPRGAVSSFASSLERCYEFIIRTILCHNDIHEFLVAEIWKQVSSQSERQLGAFIFLYTQQVGMKPEMLHHKKVAFRNQVIHKGKIATRKEALDFGQAVLDIERSLLVQVKAHCDRAMRQVVLSQMNDCAQKEGDLPAITTTIPTIISLNYVVPEKTLEDSIADLK